MTSDFHILDAARGIVASRESRASRKSPGLDFAQRIRRVVLVITSIWLGVMWRNILILGCPSQRPVTNYIQVLKHEVSFKCIRRDDLSATYFPVISKANSSCVWSQLWTRSEASFLDVI
ncbi:hypothetical protein BDZ89DRAFT_1078510 [Hymenopellis radicata]|nr:hypothetical protein BDZ89DRAFT_1078510 [Hymenopellis radicata]